MKSDNCRFHPAMTRNTPWKRGVDKGGAAGSGIGNRARPLQGRTPAMKIDQTDFNTVLASDSVDNTGGCGPFTRMPYRRCAPSSPPT